MEVIFAIFSMVAVGVFCGGSVHVWWTERWEWNEGVCRETGEPWIYFDTDSQGGRGYKSDVNGEHNVTWISWPGIDK